MCLSDFTSIGDQTKAKPEPLRTLLLRTAVDGFIGGVIVLAIVVAAVSAVPS